MVNRWTVPIVVVVAVFLGLGGLGALYARSRAQVNQVALASSPKAVTAVASERTTYRATRRHVGTLQPWQVARLGPQSLSAFLQDVQARPGDEVKRGQLLASLDCRRASVASQAVAMQARALEERQRAIGDEAARVKKMLEGGFVSENEVQQKQAQSAAEQAQLMALRSQLAGKSLEASDCALRAPFDGEVSERTADPGAYARPGAAVLTVIDRRTIRLTVEVPESDFASVAPGASASLHLLATGDRVEARIARRSPAADVATRTIHAEIDLPDPERRLPVGTTAEVTVGVGSESPAIEMPLTAAKVRGSRAALFVLEGDVVRSVTAEVLGEAGSSLFVKPTLPEGARVVTEGRAQLSDGERVVAKVEPLRRAGEKKP